MRLFVVRINKQQVNIFGLPLPPAVKDGWTIIAAATLVGLPFAARVAVVADSLGVMTFLQRLPGGFISSDSAIGLVVAAGEAVIVGAFFYWVFSSGSRFLVRSVKTHLDSRHPDKAAAVLTIFCHMLFFRDWRRNPWLREFAIANGIVDRKARLRRFANRLGAT